MKEFELPKKYRWEQLHLPVDSVIENGVIVPSTPGNGDVYITTSARKTYYMMGKIDSAVYTNLQFHLANPGKQYIGDQLIIISQPDTTADDITYCYDDPYFYLTRCGGPANPPCSDFNDGSQERDVTIFTFDGEKFCATYDNC